MHIINTSIAAYNHTIIDIHTEQILVGGHMQGEQNIAYTYSHTYLYSYNILQMNISFVFVGFKKKNSKEKNKKLFK